MIGEVLIEEKSLQLKCFKVDTIRTLLLPKIGNQTKQKSLLEPIIEILS
jgi:hypothetical protein